MKRIELTQGYIASVSSRDFTRCMSGTKWYAVVARRKDGTLRNVYVRRSVNGVKQSLHRFILGVTDPSIEVDHKDGDGLNCQRRNLRCATRPQNQQNRGANRNNTSGHKGVTWDKRRGKWVAQIRHNYKHLFLGYFADPEAANRARKAGEGKLHWRKP